jgi:hypothetical protein
VYVVACLISEKANLNLQYSSFLQGSIQLEESGGPAIESDRPTQQQFLSSLRFVQNPGHDKVVVCLFLCVYARLVPAVMCDPVGWLFVNCRERSCLQRCRLFSLYTVELGYKVVKGTE